MVRRIKRLTQTIGDTAHRVQSSIGQPENAAAVAAGLGSELPSCSEVSMTIVWDIFSETSCREVIGRLSPVFRDLLVVLRGVGFGKSYLVDLVTWIRAHALGIGRRFRPGWDS